jgi:hypothetical protein
MISSEDTFSQVIERLDRRCKTAAFQEEAKSFIRLSSCVPREQLETKFTI